MLLFLVDNVRHWTNIKFQILSKWRYSTTTLRATRDYTDAGTIDEFGPAF